MSNQIGSLKMGQKFKKTPAGEIPVDWDVMPVKSLTQKMLNGGTPDRSIGKYWDGKIPWISGADFSEQKVAEVRRFITPEAVKNSSTNVIPKGALLIVTRTGVGKLAIAPFDIAISQDITGVVPYSKLISSEFLFWMLNFHITKLKANHQGTSINGILREDLESFLLPVPVLREQDKIVKILTAVNDLMNKAATEIEKTTELKKGLMRQLLPRGIGPKKLKKTPSGEIPVDWETRTLGELSTDIYRYPTYFNIKYVQGGVPEVRGELIGANGQLEKDTSKYRYISLETAAKFPRTKLEEGDFVLSVRGTMGKVAIVTKEFIGANMTANLIHISPNRKLVIPNWLLHVFLGECFQRKLAAASSSTTIKTITAPELKNIKVLCPPLNKQQEIVDMLSGLDTQLGTAVSSWEKTEELKKGLMNMLLTGKVRV